MDLGIGKIDINLHSFMSQKDPFKINRPRSRGPSLAFQAGQAVGTAKNTSRKIQSKFGRKRFQVLTISGGTVRRHTFNSERQARAFRENSRASGAFENVSEVGQL